MKILDDMPSLVRLCLWTAVGLFSSVSVQASPWIEANDPYLRSDLQLLADSGLLLVPLNAFPVRWSLLADQFAALDPSTLSPAQLQAYRSVQYRLDSERLGRGRTHLTLSGASDADAGLQGFGGKSRTEYGITASHEEVADRWAGRLSAGYHQAEESDDHWHGEGSYLAWGGRDVAISAGWLERWWGPGWQQALAWGQEAKPLPGLSASYQHPHAGLLGSLWVETLLAKQDNPLDADKLWATRLVTRPTNWLQLGTSYKQWFGGSDAADPVLADKSNGMWTLDGRLAMPLSASATGAVYSEYATDRQTDVSYRLLGGELRWQIGREAIHAVIEQQQGDDDREQQQSLWLHKDQPMTDAIQGRRLTTGGYVQLHNDHAFALFWQQDALLNQESNDTWRGEYQLPAFAGRLKSQLAYRDQPAQDQDKVFGGLVYEYRFH